MVSKQDKTKYDKTRQKPLYPIGQDNPIGEIEFKEQAEESEIYLLPLFGVPQKYEAHSLNIFL